MQFLADICKSMNYAGYLTIDDLYELSEKQVIEKILTCNDNYIVESFKSFQEADTVYSSQELVKGKYCIKVNPKKRYVIPLVKNGDVVVRINKLSEKADKQINEFLNTKNDSWTYFDFDFKPYGN